MPRMVPPGRGDRKIRFLLIAPMIALFLRKPLILLYILFLPVAVNAHAADDLSSTNRRARRAYLEAEQAYRQYNHTLAIQNLEDALGRDPDFVEAHILMADILYHDGRYQESIDHYHDAIELDPNFFPQAKYYLGKAYFNTALYDDAVLWLEAFGQLDGLTLSDGDRLDRALSHAHFAQEAVQNPVPFTPRNAGPAVNSEHSEYSPALTADEQTLIFTRKKPMPGFEGHEDLPRDLHYEDFYVSVYSGGEWSPARNMGAPLNTPGNEGAQSITADGRVMYFTACNRADAIGSCDIYYAERIGGQWSTPVNAGRPLNSAAWDSQPSVSADGSSIYFSSSRQGGTGRRDIWKAQKNDKGEWEEPVNLGPVINTEGNEISPFIHHDNHSLYFASDGHPGMGGLDVFVSRRDPESGKWSEPVNLGYPINTHADEFALIVGASGRQAWFSSDMPGGHGKSDLYTFELYEEIRPQPVTYMKGVVACKQSGEALKAGFRLSNVSDGETVMEASSDPSDGSFLVAIPSGKNLALSVSADGYLFFSEHFRYEGLRTAADPYLRNVYLQPVSKGEPVVLRNIFFETDSYELKETSETELGKLLDFMNDNPGVIIEISGHTDSRGTFEYNLELSENRSRSVRDYLVKKGVDENRIRYKGYADTKPVDTNETPEGRARNRRTEFTIIGYDE